MEKHSHEENVELFFSHGSNLRALQEGGFLSFGYWTRKNQTYHQAVEDLLEFFLKDEPAINRGSILDVACGYGAETFRIYDRLKPEKIVAVDITEAQICPNFSFREKSVG
ncbi:MAG: class I SAM-dependent methyltransferase [Bacteroidia bacterium]